MITRAIEPVPPVAKAALPFGPAGPAAFRKKNNVTAGEAVAPSLKTPNQSEHRQQINRRQK